MKWWLAAGRAIWNVLCLIEYIIVSDIVSNPKPGHPRNRPLAPQGQ